MAKKEKDKKTVEDTPKEAAAAPEAAEAAAQEPVPEQPRRTCPRSCKRSWMRSTISACVWLRNMTISASVPRRKRMEPMPTARRTL